MMQIKKYIPNMCVTTLTHIKEEGLDFMNAYKDDISICNILSKRTGSQPVVRAVSWKYDVSTE